MAKQDPRKVLHFQKHSAIAACGRVQRGEDPEVQRATSSWERWDSTPEERCQECVDGIERHGLRPKKKAPRKKAAEGAPRGGAARIAGPGDLVKLWAFSPPFGRYVGCLGKIKSIDQRGVFIEWIAGKKANIVGLAELGPVPLSLLKHARSVPASY